MMNGTMMNGTMMNGTMMQGMGWGMMIVCLLFFAMIVLAIMALLKYLRKPG